MDARTLVVMAAGAGSRFGGPKQTAPVGPNGEWLPEYAVFDAHRAGFVEDRHGAARLSQREEWPLHEVALVARAGVARRDDERVEARALRGGKASGHA